MNHVEYRRMHGLIKLDASNPFLDPADPALKRLDAGYRYPNRISVLHAHREFHPAALRRKIEEIDPPAMFTGSAKVDVSA